MASSAAAWNEGTLRLMHGCAFYMTFHARASKSVSYAGSSYPERNEVKRRVSGPVCKLPAGS